MNHKSPAKTLRDVMRMTKFLYRKNKTRNDLSIQRQTGCDIPPVPVIMPLLSVAQVQTIDVHLSVSRALSVDIPPDPIKEPFQKLCAKPFTLQDFKDIVKQSENVSRLEKRDLQDEREKDLLDFKRSMGFPP